MSRSVFFRSVFLLCAVCLPRGHGSDGNFISSGSELFTDDILFDISWPGSPETVSLISDNNAAANSDIRGQGEEGDTNQDVAEGVKNQDGAEGVKRQFHEEGVNKEMETAGRISEDLMSEVDYQEMEYVDMQTANNERYRCIVPKIQLWGKDEEDEEVEEEEIKAEKLISALDNQCTILLMGYWTYELCHGKKLRQYHEPMKPLNGEKSHGKIDEYILGVAPSKDDEKDEPNSKYGSKTAHFESETIASKLTKDIPVWYYSGHEYPYYEVKMEGGTLCDVKDVLPRDVKIRYICDVNAHRSGTFLHIEEVATCKYEAIVATTSLCQNTAYRLKENAVHSLQCYPKDGSPSKPNSLLEHEIIMMNSYLRGTKNQKSTKPPKNQGGMSSEGTERVEEEEEEEEVKEENYRKEIRKKDKTTSLDESFIRSFLSGNMCLRGGAGWWQHEVCYGQYVKQIHEEIGMDPIEVLLGVWLEEGHRRWFTNAKDRKQSSSHVVHLYMNGDVCDITGVPRQCQVKFRCPKSGSPSKITLFLEEPTSCNYMVTVEAAFLCPLLEDTDEFGLLRLPTELKDGVVGGVASPESTKEEELDVDGNVKQENEDSESDTVESESNSGKDGNKKLASDQ